MPYRADMNSFGAGEIGRQVRGRHDTAKYKSGLDLARNVLLLPAGGFYNRAGFRHASNLKDSTAIGRLFPFTATLNQSYALEFTENMMRVYYDGGLILEPELIVTGAANTDPLVVTIPDNGYEAGQEIYFSGQEGMVELNGRTLTVDSVAGDDVTFLVDATAWGVWTASTGGVAGGSAGGEGGYPGTPPTVLPPVVDNEPPPPTCVWAESWLAPGLMAGDAVRGSPIRKMQEDGSGTFSGAVDANYAAYAPGYRVTTVSGVVLTLSDTAPVPTRRAGPDQVSYINGKLLRVGDVVPVEDWDGFRWEAVAEIEFVGMIRVAKITTGNGIYGAGDLVGRRLFTHNVKYLAVLP